MKDYKTIISEVVEATKGITDEKLKEMAFQKLLDHSLGQGHSATQKSDSPKSSSTSHSSKGTKRRSPVASIKESAIRDEVKTAFADVTPNMPGLKPLRELKQKWEKYLWVLMVAKQKDIDVMTNAEIAYVLTDKFSVGATDKTVNNLTFKAESGYVQKTTLDGSRAWKILIDGIDAIKSEK